jgi:hypothetical protein
MNIYLPIQLIEITVQPTIRQSSHLFYTKYNSPTAATLNQELLRFNQNLTYL